MKKVAVLFSPTQKDRLEILGPGAPVAWPNNAAPLGWHPGRTTGPYDEEEGRIPVSWICSDGKTVDSGSMNPEDLQLILAWNGTTHYEGLVRLARIYHVGTYFVNDVIRALLGRLGSDHPDAEWFQHDNGIPGEFMVLENK